VNNALQALLIFSEVDQVQPQVLANAVLPSEGCFAEVQVDECAVNVGPRLI
jgi:hypothetical protein